MQRDRDYLNDIVEYADDVIRLVSNVDRTSFITDDTLRSAVTYKLIVVGEAASRVSSSVTDITPQIPWPGIVGFRNQIVHGYFATDYEIVYDVATRQLPELKLQISKLLETPDQ